MLVAKVVADKQFWILQEDDRKVGNIGWLMATQTGFGDLESVGLAQVCIHRLDVATLGGGEWGDCGCGGLLVVDWVVDWVVELLLHLGPLC